MNRKKIIIICSVAILLGILGYQYVYKGHRDISSEDAVATLSVAQLNDQYTQSAEKTTQKFLDQTIVIYGKATSSDLKSKNLLIDNGVDVTLTLAETIPAAGTEVRVKGRYVGFDDLLEQHKIVDATLITE
ncbi:hypothetical protein [Flavobacterium aurantiibacter]|uniref:tRNA_anti-like n=1 Tax=Flavobacterium aurantiibacter TaxID=2023067 RepID=A0A256A0W2_9FLAO|nr:hypothetical protein [Flavobacterium aurantiibacter]OYQ46765.1 hypothetical protein CHX27_04065 [Flavobacterium aurantiibacter]